MTGPLAKQRRGCFFYGCLAGSALLVATLTMAFLGLWYLKQALNEFTDTRSVPVPVAQVSAAQGEAIQQRLEAFEQAIRDHRPVAPLAVSADDINALIATSPRLEALRGKLCLVIEGNHLKGLVSVPLSEAGLTMFAGRYLNGIATFGFSLNNGALGLWVDNFQVRGKSLPKLLMNRIRKQNLARRLKPDPHAASALDRLQDLQVRDGKLIIVPRPD
jgi:hypothetical protein